MPIDSNHPAYEKAVKQWTKIRTVLAGEEAVKLQADVLVPKPRGLKDKPLLWQEFILRGEWFPASARTVVGLLGAMFRRAPVVELPASCENWKSTITQAGLSIENFCKLCSKELLEIGRFGILVDMPETEGTSAGKRSKARPYLAGYCAEKVINWAEAAIEDPSNPGAILTAPVLVVLREEYQERKPGDRFCFESQEQIRVLYLAEDGFYYVEVWRKYKNQITTTEEWMRVSIAQPKGPNGSPLSFIPFIFVSPENMESQVERSPIADLVSINLSHFNTALDLEWACHLTANPMVYVTGYEDKGREFAVGSAVVWQFEDPEVKLGILEYTGSGISALENRAKAKEDKMAKLGANLLRTKNKQPETAETTRIEHSSESSILSMIARNSSAAITQALQWAVWWGSGVETDAKKVRVEQNTEFYDARLTYQELDSLTKSVQAGTMPVSVYVFNLIRGDMVKAGTTQEELEAEVQEALEQPRGMGSFGAAGSSVYVDPMDTKGSASGDNPWDAPADKKAKPTAADKEKAPGAPGKK